MNTMNICGDYMKPGSTLFTSANVLFAELNFILGIVGVFMMIITSVQGMCTGKTQLKSASVSVFLQNVRSVDATLPPKDQTRGIAVQRVSKKHTGTAQVGRVTTRSIRNAKNRPQSGNSESGRGSK